MHEMSTIVTDDHSTCLSVMLVGCAKTTAQIDVLFAVETLAAQRTLFLFRVPKVGMGLWGILTPCGFRGLE